MPKTLYEIFILDVQVLLYQRRTLGLLFCFRKKEHTERGVCMLLLKLFLHADMGTVFIVIDLTLGLVAACAVKSLRTALS